MMQTGSTESDSKEYGSKGSNLQPNGKFKTVFGKLDSADKLKKQLEPLFGILLLVIFLFVYTAGWPMGPLTFISALIWYISRKSKKIVFSALHEVFLSVTIGLGFFAIFLIYIKFSGSSETQLRTTEQFFLDRYESLKKLTDNLTILITIAVITILLMVDRYLKRAHTLTRFLALKKFCSRLSLTLMTITAFTFFSPNPPGGIAQDFHNKILNDFQVALRQKKMAVAKYLAADMIQQQIEQMPKATRNYDSLLFKAISEKSNGVMRNVVIKKLADEDFKIAKLEKPWPNLAGTEVENNVLKMSDGLPASKAQRDQELNSLHAEETLRDEAEEATKEKIDGLKEIFSKSLEKVTPEIAGIAGAYFGELVSEYGELIFDKCGELINLKKVIGTLDIFPKNIIDKLPRPGLFNTGDGNSDFLATRKTERDIDKLVSNQIKIISEQRRIERYKAVIEKEIQEEHEKPHVPER